MMYSIYYKIYVEYLTFISPVKNHFRKCGQFDLIGHAVEETQYVFFSFKKVKYIRNIVFVPEIRSVIASRMFGIFIVS